VSVDFATSIGVTGNIWPKFSFSAAVICIFWNSFFLVDSFQPGCLVPIDTTIAIFYDAAVG